MIKKGALDYERMDDFTGMAIVCNVGDDSIRHDWQYIEPNILWKTGKGGTVVRHIGLSDAPLYPAEVNGILRYIE